MTNWSSPQTDLVPRERLIARLKQALARRGAALIAGPGYGKTTLLKSFLARFDAPWVWCDLAEHDGDALACLRHVIGEVERAVPPLGASLSGRLRHGRVALDRALAVLDDLVAACQALPEDGLLIAVDDFHLARSGSDLEHALDHLLRRLPGRWQILVASQGEPASPELARLVQYGAVEALTEKDLGFTLEETIACLGLERPRPVSRAEASRIQALTGGWPAGTALIGRASAASFGAPLGPAAVDPTTHRYFARTVLAEIEPARRDFLIRTSVLPFVEAALCDAVLGRSDSAQQIARLIDDHLFLVRQPAQPGAYRYNALFRECLLVELQSEVSPAEVRESRRRAARYLLDAGRVEEAAEQLVAAADWSGLSDLLRAQSAALVSADRAATMLRWLDRVPADALAESPWLLLYRGLCLRVLDLPGDLQSLQRRAQLLFARQGERAGRAEALHEEAKAASLARDAADAAALCREALAIVSDDGRVRVEILGSLVFYYTMLGRLSEARDAGDEALALLPKIRDDATRTVNHLIVKRHLAFTHACGGDFHASLVLLREACELAGSEEINVRTRVRTFYLRGFVAIRRGDFDDALLYLQQAERLAQTSGLDRHVRRIRATRGEVLVTLGRIDAAEEQWQQARWFADEWVNPGYFYYRAGHYHQAIDFYEAEIARAGPASDPVNRARAQALLGASLVALGSTNAGKQLLEQALITYRDLGFYSRVPGISLHLADLAFAEGREDTGRALLADALAIAHGGGAYHFFALHPGVLHRSLERAERLGIERQFVWALAERWRDVPSQTAAPPAPLPDTGPNWLPYRDLLERCPDERIRTDLARALTEGYLTVGGVQSLLSDYGLTWRELQIFVWYYLPGYGAAPHDANHSTRRRRDLAEDLGVTEHTIRQHVSAIRGKIGIGGQRGLAIYDWAVARNIVG